MASRGIVGAGLMAVMLLTACGGRRDEAGGLPGALASASPTRAAPTVTSLPTPSATTSDGQAALRASAEYFVRDYFRLFNQANHEARPELVTGLFLPSCKQCSASAAYIYRDASRSWHLVGNNIELLSISVNAANSSNSRVRAITKTTSGYVQNNRGRKVKDARGWAPFAEEFRLVRRDGRWIVVDLTDVGPVSE